jgi:hypothetical protein
MAKATYTRHEINKETVVPVTGTRYDDDGKPVPMSSVMFQSKPGDNSSWVTVFWSNENYAFVKNDQE